MNKKQVSKKPLTMKKNMKLNSARKSLGSLLLLLVVALTGTCYDLNASVNELMQQKIQVSGKIKDDMYESLTGVNVVE